MPEDSVAGNGGRPESAMPPARSTRTVTPAVAAALLVLAASFALSVAFVLANGGLNLPAAAPQSAGSSDLAAGAPTPAATGTTDESVAPTGGPSAVANPTPATPAPSASAAPSTTPAPHSSSNRYALLTACPNKADCWVYVVRQGDNLFSIAKYFGVSIQVVEERNPWTRTTRLAAGQKLLLPPPTR